MEHRRENIMNRPHNIYAENRWRGPKSRADVEGLTRSREIGTMRWDPKASWVKEKIRPMHWDPKENWNADASVADVMNKDSFKFYDNISRSLPSERDVDYANEGGGKTRKHSIKRRKSRKHKKSNQKHKKSIRRRKH